MRALSKSKLMAYRQCPKRLWLEVHRPELREDSAATQKEFGVGHEVGDIARRLYDPEGRGVLIDIEALGFDEAFSRTRTLLQSEQPIFEAGFRAEGGLALADVMLPVRGKEGELLWRMVEVKSSTSVKDYHRDDLAIQTLVATSSGVPFAGVALAHVDSQWVYPGNEDYCGLLREADLTGEVMDRADEVRGWIRQAQAIVAQEKPPEIRTGRQCGNPYECGFIAHCMSQEPQAEYPVAWLPGRWSKALRTHVETHGTTDLRDLPDELLNDKHRRIKAATLSGAPYFDREGAARALAGHRLPAYFMDFETIQFVVPIWKGTRPYQQMPFQFSVHRLAPSGELTHQPFLDLSGKDPSRDFAQALIVACGERGPIFVYNATFEKTRIQELAERFPDLARPLAALKERVIDLKPVAESHYYHPSQKGSWSLKAVLPALCPELDYANLEGVKDGGMAQEAYLEAIAPETTASRKAELERQLLDYCARDTYALVRLWSIFSGSQMRV
jgi:hypothetical protein